MPNEMTEAQEKEWKEIQDAVMAIAKERDSGMLFMCLLTNAALLGERLIAAKLVTAEKMGEFFTEARTDALTPLDRPVAVHYKDGDEVLGRKH